MAPVPDTRPSLIVRLQNAQDEAAWSEFLALYEPLILREMRKNGLQECDARDACQQVLTAVACDVAGQTVERLHFADGSFESLEIEY
jgi:RNA polymerase sigma-70 factor (ECF subfamily)